MNKLGSTSQDGNTVNSEILTHAMLLTYFTLYS